MLKVSISEYPKFSGKAEDWIVFERKIRSVASSQGFDQILRHKDYGPSDKAEGRQYLEDHAFIYDAF